METTCDQCGCTFTANGRRGRTPRYCSPACRQAAYRARHAARPQVPAELRALDRWARADGKRPVRPDGQWASSTKPWTWSRYADVQSGAGDGLGFMVGGGVGCIDLDGCLDESGRLVGEVARRVLDANPDGYVEVSMSGRGLHLFGLLDEGPGVRRPGVEVYSRARFIRVTGRTWRAGGLEPLNII